MTLATDSGKVTRAATAGLTFAAGDGTPAAFTTFSGTLANVNAALDGLTFRPNARFGGEGGPAVLVDDQGNTGRGGPLSSLSAVRITVFDGGTLHFSPAAYSIDEGSGQATLTVVRAGGADGTTTASRCCYCVWRAGRY